MENSDEANETARLKMRIGVLEENVKSCELECKASRETVLRLVAELERERKKAASTAEALGSLKVEFDGLVVGRRSVETERETFTERLEASRRVIEAARRESHCLQRQVEDLERKLQANRGETRAAEEKLQTFLGEVAGLLQGTSEGVPVVPATEKELLHRVDKSFSEMEARLRHVSEELSKQTALQRSTDTRAQLAEQQAQDLGGRLRGLEGELLTAHMHRDGLRHSQRHYEEFLEQLTAVMKVDGIAVDLGFDMRLKLVLSRAEQLVRQEAAAWMESKTQTYSLQRKLKMQKDQLESKGLHIQLLRKKMSDLEVEERRSRSAQTAERDDARTEARRLQKKVERLQGELRAAKSSNSELKAQLSHASELKLKVTQHAQTTQAQQERLDQLLEGKAKAEKELNAAKAALRSREERSEEDRRQLQSLRLGLDRLSEREGELVDFRQVVSQMLGLDPTALARPNYDVIKELESLLHALHAHHHHHRHHLLHHASSAWHCPTHPGPHLHRMHDLPDGSSLDLCTARSGPGDASPLHED